MNEIYNEAYYKEYDVGVDKVDYEHSEYTRVFLNEIAKRIVKDLRPKCVLDAGCAMGHLVGALRDLGVEAYGIDISEYAISKVREDIKPYCAVGSITEPLPAGLPQAYDLIITIEVLEHLYPEDGRKAIHNLCSMTQRILFSSSPDDYSEKTHVNVQQREYWARLFAEEGFFDDLNYRPTYLTYYACCFKKGGDVLRLIEDYERDIRMMFSSNQELVREWTGQIEDKERHIGNQAQIIETTQTALAEARKEVEDKERHIGNQAQIIETTQTALAEARKEVEDKERHIENQNYIIETIRTVLEEVRREVADKERHIENQAQIIETTQTALAETRKEVAEKERHIENQNQIIEAEKAELEEERSRVSETKTVWLQTKTELERVGAELSQTNAELAHYKEHYFAAINQREELKANRRELEHQLESARNDYAVISNAACWKMTKPLRAFLDLLKRIPLLMLMIKALKCLKQNGFSYTWRKVKYKLNSQKQYAVLASKQVYTAEELEQQKKEVFPLPVKISIVVPLYNTPEVFLKEMIQSVLDQTYGNWELCLADGSDEEHAEVGRICRAYRRRDKRIKYTKLERNLGISGNTNACLDMATGDYIGLFDHDDLLHPAALYEVMHAICEQNADYIYTDENTFHKTPEDAYCPNFKPDYAPDTLRSYNYICHFSVFSKELMERSGGGFRSEFDGSQDYDMILRLTENAEHIIHIPKILYFWRSHEASVASGIEAKPYTLVAAKKALSEHLARCGLKGEVQDARIPSTYRIQYEIEGTPLISILIPNKDHRADLKKCIDSIRERSSYGNWEIIIIENNSTEPETFALYHELEMDRRIRVVRWEDEFNFSAINNFGARYAQGEHLLLLNNDVEVITPDWLEQMLMFSQRKDVGAVGAMLYYPDDTVQHAGVILGIGGVGGHAHKYFKRGDYGYMSRLAIAQNFSAVTAACLMLRRAVWDEVHGLDEGFKIAFNDVDFCMRIRKAGFLIVWTPFAELYHYESKSRGLEDTPDKQRRFAGEIERFQTRWKKELAAGDPYYNCNLTLTREDFSLK